MAAGANLERQVFEKELLNEPSERFAAMGYWGSGDV